MAAYGCVRIELDISKNLLSREWMIQFKNDSFYLKKKFSQLKI